MPRRYSVDKVAADARGCDVDIPYESDGRGNSVARPRYVAALRRFEEQVAGTDLVCPGKIDALFAKALPYACAGAPRAATERVLRGSARRC